MSCTWALFLFIITEALCTSASLIVVTTSPRLPTKHCTVWIDFGKKTVWIDFGKKKTICRVPWILGKRNVKGSGCMCHLYHDILSTLGFWLTVSFTMTLKSPVVLKPLRYRISRNEKTIRFFRLCISSGDYIFPMNTLFI